MNCNKMEESKSSAVALLPDMCKRLCVALLLIPVLWSCAEHADERRIGTDAVEVPYSADGKDKASKLPVMTFKESDIDAGRILQGDEVTHTYTFTNTGKKPLVISDISSSCGCTVPRNYPKGKIMPGEGGDIEVTYNSDAKWGDQVSVIAITANTQPNRTELLLRAHVVAPDKP